MRHDITTHALAAVLALIATSPAWSKGPGPVKSSQSITCKFSRDHQGSRLILNGSCSGAIDFSISIQVETPSASRTRGWYERTPRQGTGHVVDL